MIGIGTGTGTGTGTAPIIDDDGVRNDGGGVRIDGSIRVGSVEKGRSGGVVAAAVEITDGERQRPFDEWSPRCSAAPQGQGDGQQPSHPPSSCRQRSHHRILVRGAVVPAPPITNIREATPKS